MELRERVDLRCVYQPIVDLATSDVVAYEALARGPEGTDLESPAALFAAARASGQLAELDWRCRCAALEGARGLPARRTLFVNVEPAAVGTACPPELRATWERGLAELPVVFEVTERALTARPRDLLRAIEEARSLGAGIALDDIGADVRSLALMPLLQPDVLKLDLRLVQARPDAEVAAIVAAVNAEHERSGALVLAEGIETPAHLATARAMGAVLGQGWLLGRPGPLPAGARPVARPRDLRPVSRRLGDGQAAATPFAVVAQAREIRRGDKQLLLAVTRQLEQWVPSLGGGAVLLSAFQDATRFTPATAERYEALARQASLVAAFGVGMQAEPAPGVRGAALPLDDPLRGEWSVAVLGPHQAGALIARDLGDTGPDRDRRFDFALTYDRDLVVAAAHTLLRRIDPDMSISA